MKALSAFIFSTDTGYSTWKNMDNKKPSARKITLHYALTFAAFYSAFCMVRSFISVYLQDLGFTYTQVGIITGIHIFLAAAIQPFFAVILNHFPKMNLHRFMALSCIPAILGSVLTFLLPARMVFFIPIYMLFGLFQIGMQSIVISIGMEYVNAGIPLDMGLGHGFGSIGYAAANIILGMLIVRYGSPISQNLNIILLIVLSILLFSLPDPDTGNNTDSEAEPGNNEPADSLWTFLQSNTPIARFCLSVVFIFFGHAVVNTYMPNVAAQFGLKSDFTGAMNALAAFLELIPMMLYSRISKKISPMTMLKFSAVFFSIKILLATLARNGTELAASQSMQILAYAVYAMASIYFTNQAVKPRNRVMAQGLLVGACEAGFMVGGFIGGIVLDLASIRVLLWAGVAVTVIGSILMITAVRQFESRCS